MTGTFRVYLTGVGERFIEYSADVYSWTTGDDEEPGELNVWLRETDDSDEECVATFAPGQWIHVRKMKHGQAS